METTLNFKRTLRKRVGLCCDKAVQVGLRPNLFGHRYQQRESLREHIRIKRIDAPESSPARVIHAPAVAINPLPQNISDRDTLPNDRGWWGYSFWDVPERESGETIVATLPNCRVIPSRNDIGEFWATILTGNDRALELRELSFRSWQAPFIRGQESVRLKRATWVVERVYDNYSHWLTAHLPKLLMLREQGLDTDVILPDELAPAVEASLRLFGMPPENFQRFDTNKSLDVEELTVVSSDRFRPELLKLVASHCPVPVAERPIRRVFISRTGATRRRLLNEEELWQHLKNAGFERVRMETLDFEQQVRLMRETAVLVAPHGAGLTNMMFCPEGTHVVEFADLTFPNPNFYAVASALRLKYWLLSAEGRGDVHPLEKDLWIAPRSLRDTLDQIL